MFFRTAFYSVFFGLFTFSSFLFAQVTSSTITISVTANIPAACNIGRDVIEHKKVNQTGHAIMVQCSPNVNYSVMTSSDSVALRHAQQTQSGKRYAESSVGWDNSASLIKTATGQPEHIHLYPSSSSSLNRTKENNDDAVLVTVSW